MLIVAVDASLVILASSIGLTLIVTKSFLMKGFRLMAIGLNPYAGKLFACGMCFGFWAFILCYWIYRIAPIVNYCFIASLLSYTYILLFDDRMDRHG
jgi:hypothetical protein